MKHITMRLLSFGLVGGVGFIVDGGILQVLYSFAGMDAIAARAISFPSAVTATWLLNKRITFRDRNVQRRANRYALYFVGQILGALINVLVYVVAIRTWPTIAHRPLIPLAAGSAVAMFFNYAWANLLVFANRSSAAASVVRRVGMDD
jgi:putative flippase GtrA